MIIKEWWFKNYKSYGNIKQTITFNDKGELILLVGPSGNGKSSILSSLDLSIYGEELNKHGKRLPYKNLPNRNNGNLEVGVIFETDQNLKITRTMDGVNGSLKSKLFIDGIPYDKANKIQDKIIEKIGYDFKTYKSFISMNVNNFKNFISLSPEEKRLLLDKLFNLDQINELNKILKQLQKNNETSFNSLNSEITIYTENIKELNETINLVIEKNKNNNESKLKELKELIKSNKELYLDLENKKDELYNEIDEFKTGINNLKYKVKDINRDIQDINEKIALYEGGKCPTCLTILTGQLDLSSDYKERLEKSLLIKEKTNNKITKAEKELINIQNNYQNVSLEFSKLVELINTTKIEINSLKQEKTDNIDDFKNNITSLETKKNKKEKEYIETQKLKYVYDILLPMWGEHGIKRDIIDSIIDPINEFITEDLKFLKTRFRLELDNNFDAHIFEWNNEIDSETLSTGEAKKVNLIIMLAYIKMLRMKQNINILFLDEVFSGLDPESINDVLTLFKNFANDRNINIILVHHSDLKEWFFDRIIYVNKNTFSYLEEKQID